MPSCRRITRTGYCVALAALLLFCLAGAVFGMAGGGGGYGGGGGGGGGGDDAAILELVFYLIQLCIEYPYIGLPLTAAVIVLVIVVKRQSHDAYRGYVIRCGAGALDNIQHAQAADTIRAHDPSFDEAHFLGRVRSAFTRIQDAWCTQNLDLARQFVSDSIYERFSLQLQEQKELGYRDRMDDLSIASCALAQAVSDGCYDTVTVRFSGTTRDYRVDLKGGQALGGGQYLKDFEEYWTLLRRRGVQTRVGQAGLLEGHCPNCGAAIEMNQFANCQHCKALLRSGQYDWVLVEITQGCEWRPAAARALPGLSGLQRRDPEFTLAHLEDRASVMFWRWIMSCRSADAAPLRKMASAEFCETLQRDFKAKTANGRTYYGECAVGTVATLGILAGAEVDRAVVEVRWDGVRFVAQPGGQAQRTERGAIRRTVFLLGRKAGAQSGEHNGVGSAHCPYCGAPESSGVAAACDYCGKALNEGVLNWNLLGLWPWYAREATDLINELRNADAPPKASAPAGSAGVPAGGSAGVPAGTEAGATMAAAPMPNALELLAWMVKLAAVDGQVAEKERAFLQQTAAQQGIEAARLETMLSAALHNELQAAEPRDRVEALRWLEALAEMALADGKVSGGEWNLLKQVGARQGLVLADISMLVQKTRVRLYQQARTALRKRPEA